MPFVTRSPLAVPVCLLAATLALGLPFTSSSLSAQSPAPGGFLDVSGSQAARPLLTAAAVQSFMPARGRFTFPAPYGTQGIRITTASDCGGGDCVRPVGYSFWRNINNHAGSDTMFIFMGLDRQKGGGGPTLFSYSKSTGATSNLGPLFDASNPLAASTAEGWYFSATRPHALYAFTGAKLLRVDVQSRATETVFDATTQFGANRYIWNVHSSNDDRVHSFTLRDSGSYAMLGCAAYREDTRQYTWVPRSGEFDECQIDKSGRYLVIKEQVDGAYGEDNTIVDLQTGTRQVLLDQDGAAGHSDNGFGYLVAEDNFAPIPGAVRVWRLDADVRDGSQGTLVFHSSSWSFGANHIAHSNSKPGTPLDQQYACSSSANRQNLPLSNEVLCYPLDGSLNVLVVAPVMTNLDASGGGSDLYWKYPKGNVDVTGEYFIWTTNLGGNRLDAVMVRIPAHLLPNGPGDDTTLPTVAVTAPAHGATVGGTVGVSASASDNVGVAGVRFQLDGADLGPEDTSAPYGLSWQTTTAANGSHTLRAIARDVSGNVSISAPVTITVQNAVSTSFNVSDVAATSVSTSAATIGWTSSAPADSQVEYGATASYGAATGLNASMVVAHAQTLSGLAPGTTYHFRVRSRNSSGVLAVSADATFTTPAVSSPSLSTELVEWTSLVNARVNGTMLVKAGGCAGCPDAGAASRQRVTGGDGYLEFRVADPNPMLYIGLGTANPGTTGDEIRFALRQQGGRVEVRESGAYRADTTIVKNDVLRIAIAGGRVRYSKNGQVFYVSTLAPTYPLLVDAALYDAGATVSRAVLAMAPGAATVQWTSLVNTSAGSGLLAKSGGCGGCPDAGAVSQQQIVYGNATLAFTVPEAGGLRFIGLSNGNPGTSGNEIRFALRIQGGVAEVRESGTYRRDTTVSAGDRLTISVQAGVVRYAKNGAVFYQSGLPAAYPLLVDTAFYDANTSISNATLLTDGS